MFLKRTLPVLFMFTLCFFLPRNSTAQGTLQFSQVLNLKGDCTAGDRVIGTVPAGKVWKIESLASYGVSFMLDVNGASVKLSYSDQNYPSIGPGDTRGSQLVQAFWLREGEILKVDCGSNINSFLFYTSIIEFNIVP